MLKKTVFCLFVSLFFLFLAPVSALAHEAGAPISPAEAAAPVPVTVLVREDCVHCREEKAFLADLATRRADFSLEYVDVQTEAGREQWERLAATEGLSRVTPLTLVANRVIQGFDTPETTGKIIENLIEASKGRHTMTLSEFLAAGGGLGGAEPIKAAACGDPNDPFGECVLGAEKPPLLYSIPFVGSVDLADYSLSALSAILGFIDGFNPCAMWVLVTFLVILIQAGDRKKMWTIAGLFILAEAIMYYLILVFWLKTWDFVGLDRLVTPIVGAVAIGGGLFFLYEWRKADGSCQIIDHKTRARTVSKINSLVAAEMTIATLLGIVLLALSVNVIEFACSIGIPQAFTKVLEINQLSTFSTHGYISLYILFYMIDDLIVFGIALWGMEKLGLTTKYVKFSNFLGGILMLILGFLLIFKPEWLVFQ